MHDRPNRARAAALIRAMAPVAPTLRIRIAGEIDEAMASRIMSTVRAAPFAGRIETSLDSPGGLAVQAFAIARAIEEHGAAVKACRILEASSAAMLVALGHNVRSAPRSARALFHSCELTDSPTLPRMDAISFMRLGRRLHEADKEFGAYVAERTDLSASDVDRLMLGARRLDAFALLRAGIVHEIEGVTRPPSAALARGWKPPATVAGLSESFARSRVRMASPRALMGTLRHLGGASFRAACEALAAEAAGGTA